MDIQNMESTDIRAELESHGIKVHHKTGIDKLRSTLSDVLDGSYAPEEVVKSIDSDAPVDPKDVKILSVAEHRAKLTKEQRAMLVTRIVVSPNDPLMSSYPGLIFTVGSSAVNNGRMIKKYVPFNNDEGWHVPQIILDQIEAAQMQKFRTVTAPNGDKVLQPYLTKKFNVQILDPLTPTEMASLAAAQQAKGAA